MVCSLHSVTTGSRDRANVPLIIIIIYPLQLTTTTKYSCNNASSFFRFHRENIVDNMYLYEVPVLHILSESKTFSPSCLVNSSLIDG